jgi:hypothetical protein
MAYGTIKIDTITFTDGGVDKSVSVSGLVQNPTFTGNITVTGTVSGNIVRGQTISGVTITGTTAQFASGTFVSLTGTTLQGTTATYTTGSFTSLTGTTTSGTTANFVSGVFSTQISGVTVTGTTANFTSGNFTNISGGTHTITSGVFASGTAVNPSISFVSDPNSGLYSPGADQVAISTNGTGRLFVDSSGLLGLGTSSPAPVIGNGATLHLYGASTTSELRLQRGNGTDLSLFAGSAAGGAAISLNNKFSISTDSNSTQAFTVDTSGRVGIGLTSPATTLDVNGDVTIADKIIHGGDTNTAIRFPAADTVSVETAGSERARIDSSGRLLVGTSSQSGGSLLQVNDNRIRIATAKTPASATDTGVAGEICWDANYVYVCTATNTWKRTAISTW